MTSKLLTPIQHEDNIRNVHFFNGRLLTAEDLRDEQLAHRIQRQQLGKAIGTGVVEGLQVTMLKSEEDTITTQVSISPGLALNKYGQAIMLPDNVEIALVGDPPEESVPTGIFQDCDVKTVESERYQGTGPYVLTIAPASEFAGNVPAHQLSDDGVMTGCGRRYAVEMVMLNLVRISYDYESLLVAPIDPENEIQRLSQLRNVLAHLCLGTIDVAEFGEDALTRVNGASPYRLYGTRKYVALSDCEVPLALIYLTPGGIQFIDTWAVRRRPTPIVPSGDWPLSVGARRSVENEAAFLQFQDQMNWLETQRNIADLGTIKAIDYFRFFPSGGLLLRDGTEDHGDNLKHFLTDIDHNEEDILISGTRLNDILNRSFYHGSIDLKNENDRALMLYRTEENKAAVSRVGSTAHPFVLFTSHNMPLLSTSQLNEHRWTDSYFG